MAGAIEVIEELFLFMLRTALRKTLQFYLAFSFFITSYRSKIVPP